jgi:nitrite reductase (NO-forming)
VGRIEIASASGDPRVPRRPIMSDHNVSARLWATAAVVAVPLLSALGVGWWLPVHVAMLGAASQAIVGGQLMFSTTLGLARGPARWLTLTQLALLNIGAVLVVTGRVWSLVYVLAGGATIFVATVCWVACQVCVLWRRSINRRFAITGTFYALAAFSVILGASIGGALGIGVFHDPSSYLVHRSLHMTLNVLGWAGLTIVGTAVTLLPTILHVRAPKTHILLRVPWLMFGGLIVLSTGATIGSGLIAATGMVSYVGGLVAFALYVRQILVIPRRRRVPTAALHLIAAFAWCAVTSVTLIGSFARSDPSLTRDVLVVGGAGGLVFQALIGAWSFLLPSTRSPVPERRRSELTAMELLGRPQVIAYNAGLVAILVGLQTGIDGSLVGTVIAWLAAAWAIAKSWSFPLLARLPYVRAQSDHWWATPREVTRSRTA